MTTTESREKRLISTFVRLADTLVVGFDVVDLLQTLVDSSAELLNAVEAGIMLADEKGELSVVASTSEAGTLIDLMQLRSGLGPCIDSYTSATTIRVPDISGDTRWPGFAGEAMAAGYRSVHAVPLRLRNNVIGTLNLFFGEPGALTEEDESVAQGLADVATIGILQERAIREGSQAREQLQRALDSRVLIEQAKGVVAQQRDVGMDAAFKTIRDYARFNGRNLRDVADEIVNRKLLL
jgi:GAF domain-containing protein